MSGPSRTGVKVYGCNHVAIEVDDIETAVAFYQDVFNLEKLDRGEGDAFFKLGEHQFLAIFEVEKVQPANMRHFGIMVRDEEQIEEVRQKLTKKYKLKLEPPFCYDSESETLMRIITSWLKINRTLGASVAATLFFCALLALGKTLSGGGGVSTIRKSSGTGPTQKLKAPVGTLIFDNSVNDGGEFEEGRPAESTYAAVVHFTNTVTVNE